MHTISAPASVADEVGAVERAARALRGARRVLFGTGAGMSADSGVPTYRDEGGRWRDFPPFTARGLRPADIAHADGYRQDPHRAWAFHEHVRRLAARAAPHGGYPVITRWMRERWPDSFLLTTNIDGLHRRAGVDEHRLWERYGNLFELQCVEACEGDFWPEPRVPFAEIDDETLRATSIPRCPHCGGAARPRVQLDHDPVMVARPEGGARYTRFVAEPVDVYVVIGTTLWFSWPDGEPRPTVVHINPNPDTHARYEDPIAITMGAEDALLGIDWFLRRLDARADASASMAEPAPSGSWFAQLFGFEEEEYEATRARFELDGDALVSRANGRRFGVGRFSTPSLDELRTQTATLRPGRLRLCHEVVSDALELHARPENVGALFQVASQLNCLEFAGPEELPEHGVTQYASDPTQGPACSLAAAAATVYRNYFVEVGDTRGQRRDRQIDNLADLQARLGRAGELVTVRNGYAFSTPDDLVSLGVALAGHDRDALMGALRVGLQVGAEVTFARRFAPPPRPRRVSQVFCSALSCGYASGSLAQWRPIATLVLDAAYEATLRAALLDAERGEGSGVVWLTFLGGGAFGNAPPWIAAAIGRALALLDDRALDVRVAHHRRLDHAMIDAIAEARDAALAR